MNRTHGGALGCWLIAVPFWLALFCWGGAASAQTAVFVVSEIGSPCVHCDSFLLPLSNPEDIADARALVENGPSGRVGSIPVLAITAGPDGLNRDVLANGEPLWDWHVSGFVGFADFTIELCDGWPGFIESDPAAFIANTGGQFCPWSYSVTAELAPPPTIPSSSSWTAFVLGLLLLSLAYGSVRRRSTPCRRTRNSGDESPGGQEAALTGPRGRARLSTGDASS